MHIKTFYNLVRYLIVRKWFLISLKNFKASNYQQPTDFHFSVPISILAAAVDLRPGQTDVLDRFQIKFPSQDLQGERLPIALCIPEDVLSSTLSRKLCNRGGHYLTTNSKFKNIGELLKNLYWF